jgi:hypothetical protein
MLKKLLTICLILFLILPLVMSCTATNSSDPLLVPAIANTVVEVQVGKILSNPVLLIAYNELAKNNPAWPQTTNDALDQLLQKTGLDLSNISTAIYFADIESSSQPQNNYGGMIVSGSFNQSTLIAKIQQQTKQNLTTSNYEGLPIYTGERDQFAIAFLSQSQFAAGTLKAVQDVIDVSNGNQPALGGSIIETLNRLGPSLISGASVPPQNLLNQLGKEVTQKTTLSSESFQNLSSIGFSISQPSLSLNVTIDAQFSNTASVQDAKNVVAGLISGAKGTSQDPEIKAALSNIHVNTSNSWLSVQDLLNPADIANLIGSIPKQK